MRIGLIAVATKTGLGYQTKAFYDHLKPYKTMVVDIQELNGQEQYYGWYSGANFIKGIPKKDQIQRFLQDLDVVFTCETPYNYELYTIAKNMGVKTVNQYNPEFFDHFIHNYPMPDMFIAPSMWKFKEIDLFCKSNNIKHKYLHFPVDRAIFTYRNRTTKKIMHVAGKPAAHDRNGTWDFMQAVPNGVVVTQDESFAKQIRTRYRQCNVFTKVPNPENMYNFGDIMIMPRRYGGNCLPLNEALSCGLPVIMPDVSPNNHLLPKEWLVEARITGYFEPRVKVDLYSVDPASLHKKVKEIKESWNIAEESKKADEIAKSISWEVMYDKYIETFEELCES